MLNNIFKNTHHMSTSVDIFRKLDQLICFEVKDRIGNYVVKDTVWRLRDALWPCVGDSPFLLAMRWGSVFRTNCLTRRESSLAIRRTHISHLFLSTCAGVLTVVKNAFCRLRGIFSLSVQFEEWKSVLQGHLDLRGLIIQKTMNMLHDILPTLTDLFLGNSLIKQCN